MKKSYQWFMVLAVMVGLVLAACAPKAPSAPTPSPSASPAPSPAPAPQSSEWDKILAAAKKEGTVTVYVSVGADLSAALKEGIKQYGINMEAVGGTGGELELRIATEQRAKSYAADLLVGGWRNQLNVVTAGNAQPVTAPLPTLQEKDVWRIEPWKYDSTKSAFVVSTSLDPVLIYNTDLVRPGEIQTMQDLLDPRWRGQMVMTDPRPGSGPGTSDMVATMVLGEDFWKKMAAQNISLQTSYVLVIQQVVSGAKAIGLFPDFSTATVAIRAGAPIKMFHMKEGAIYHVNGVAFIKNAPHPNAAMVLFNWILTKEGQTAVGKALASSSIRKDTKENWIAIAEMRPDLYRLLEPPANVDPSLTPKAVDFAKKVFGTN